MNYTEEQKDAMYHRGDLIVKAGAGSGKSTLCLGHASLYPELRKLILFFNKSMADEMTHKAKKMNIKNLDIRTSHSLAFKKMNIYGSFEIGNFHAYDILKTVPKMKQTQENMGICSIALKLYTKYNISADDTWEETSEYFFKDSIYDRLDLADKRKIVLMVDHIDKMIREKKLPMLHSTYLKWFQLQKRKLNYDIIYIDEFQDTAPVVLDIFRNQDHMIRIGIGDESQQIMGWNGAIDALKKFPEFSQKYLTQSFRFPQFIADKANEILSWKKYLGEDYYDSEMKIKGYDEAKSNNYRAIIARTNSQILGKAIQDVFEYGEYKKVCFIGGFDGYVNNGIVSIYDVLNLKNKKKDQVRSEFVSSFADYKAFMEFAEEHEDNDLLRTIGLVNKHGNALFQYLPKLKQMDCKADNAEVIAGTAHRAKGLEFGTVEMLDGFTTFGDVKKIVKEIALLENEEMKKDELDKLSEEINLDYVVITRTQKNGYVPSDLFKDKVEEKI